MAIQSQAFPIDQSGYKIRCGETGQEQGSVGYMKNVGEQCRVRATQEVAGKYGHKNFEYIERTQECDDCGSELKNRSPDRLLRPSLHMAFYLVSTNMCHAPVCAAMGQIFRIIQAPGGQCPPYRPPPPWSSSAYPPSCPSASSSAWWSASRSSASRRALALSASLPIM